MTNYILNNQPELKKVVSKMPREVLERLFLAGKTPGSTTSEELEELINTENFFMCAENFNEACKKYRENMDSYYQDSFQNLWGLLQKAAEDLYVLKKAGQ